ncbi:MAG: LysE family translocator [Rhodospirillaceae bacterium]|nr:LysE family translocator [Rhodospirillaceae bacterium]
MALEDLLALAVFAFVTSITPGPSNFMLLTSGANFGFVRTLPQVLGITIGFKALLLGVGLGLGGLLTAYPVLHVMLKIGGAAYLLYLAWRIGMSRAIGSAPDGDGMDGAAAGRPLTFLESAIFQWVNPKAWVVAVTVMALYTNEASPFLSVLLIAVAFAIVNLPSVSTWAWLGVSLRGFLADPVRLKWFNIAMGLALAATLWPLIA